MLRSPKLPLLPGYSFDREIGQTRFHKSTQFEYLRGLVPYLTEADRPGTGGFPFAWETPDTSPSTYPRRECKELPGWLVFDKQILTFEAYFQEAMCEVDKSAYQVRRVKILFFPEDGTIQVNEPKVENSGMTQGLFIARQRIRFPKPMDHAFYDLIDFNIGKNVELFGRIFRIVNCDKFTRNFLNRMGIFVGDPINYPEDPYVIEQEKKKFTLIGKKPKKTTSDAGKYLEYDKKVLRFFGYWDDRSSQYGYVHKLEIKFYLASDVMEIQEIIPPNSGIDSGPMFLKKNKLPKFYVGLPGLGDRETNTLLNVLPTGFLKGRYMVDPLSSYGEKTSYYRDNDLAIGAALNVFGRKVILVDCDEYTKEYYRSKYGVDTFEKLPIPEDANVIVTQAKELPPWNGIGSYEDSEGNCIRVFPKAPKRDMFKFLAKGRMGVDSHVLRFKAKMISNDPINDDRSFILAYFLTDDQISIFERGLRNSGFTSQYFCKKREIFKPDQDRFVSVKPEVFLKEDLWIGNTLKIEGFVFKLVKADEYCLRYMELHSQEFPKSNAKLILDKVREKLRPIYKQFVSSCLLCNLEPCEGTNGAISYCNFKNAFSELMGTDITEHEIITLARQYRIQGPDNRRTKIEVLDTCRTELRRKIWMGFDRLKENMHYKDPCRTGFIDEKIALSLCKGAKISVEPELLITIMKLVDKNECGQVSIEDLLNFFDTQKSLHRPVTPFNHRREFSEFEALKENKDYAWVDFDCLIGGIGLEEELAKEGQTEGAVAKPEIPPV